LVAASQPGVPPGQNLYQQEHAEHYRQKQDAAKGLIRAALARARRGAAGAAGSRAPPSISAMA
jgi:hypothetical protein